MDQGREMTRFTASGKTFFFNEKEARNGTRYLCINTIYGNGIQERVTIFPSQLPEFFKGVRDSMEELLDLRVVGRGDPTRLPKFPTRCPECGLTDEEGFTMDFAQSSPRDWAWECAECGSVILSTEDYNGEE